MFFLLILVLSIVCGIPSEANHIMDQSDLIAEHKEGMEHIQVEVNVEEKDKIMNDEIQNTDAIQMEKLHIPLPEIFFLLIIVMLWLKISNRVPRTFIRIIGCKTSGNSLKSKTGPIFSQVNVLPPYRDFSNCVVYI